MGSPGCIHTGLGKRKRQPTAESDQVLGTEESDNAADAKRRPPWRNGQNIWARRRQQLDDTDLEAESRTTKGRAIMANASENTEAEATGNGLPSQGATGTLCATTRGSNLGRNQNQNQTRGAGHNDPYGSNVAGGDAASHEPNVTRRITRSQTRTHGRVLELEAAQNAPPRQEDADADAEVDECMDSVTSSCVKRQPWAGSGDDADDDGGLDVDGKLG
ncbi:hypothetical protein VFPPC_16425 [Pochonia chlamydosporia 170]|uniref:Uncharacterized protein n=1 Tax=Pochonia chlamydosporia 170 TaxID=1380566 RepID=A0A179FC98_METCM|nr:hypothetical protein VFPPC_16425 [Pochonia chlamydosporia 170]OAQ63114.1 hypothetical protein VFPPC_16425 [Pochonia chlamydosporia 170]